MAVLLSLQSKQWRLEIAGPLAELPPFVPAPVDSVIAVEGPANGVVFYPRILRLVHAFPGLGRRHARGAARRSDLLDTTVRVGGSSGAAEIRAEREAWEQDRGSR